MHCGNPDSSRRRACGRRRAGLAAAAVALALTVGATGCVTQRTSSHTPRTATEQLLVAEAAERAVDGLELPGVEGRRVAIELVGLGPGADFYADLPYLRAALEARLRRDGAVVVPADAAERILAVRVGALGTTGRTTTFGVPAVSLGVAATPEINFYRFTSSSGFAKLRAAQRDAEGGDLDREAPVFERTRFREWRVLLFSFRSDRDVYPEGRGPG